MEPPLPVIWALSIGLTAVVALAVMVAVLVAVTLLLATKAIEPPEVFGLAVAVAAAAWAT